MTEILKEAAHIFENGWGKKAREKVEKVVAPSVAQAVPDAPVTASQTGAASGAEAPATAPASAAPSEAAPTAPAEPAKLSLVQKIKATLASGEKEAETEIEKLLSGE